MTKKIGADNFENDVLKSDVPVLLDFWAEWCGPCRMVSPVLDKIAGDYSGKVVVGKVNVDEQRALASKYGIMSIPTVMLFKDGEVIDQSVGARDYGYYAKLIDNNA